MMNGKTIMIDKPEREVNNGTLLSALWFASILIAGLGIKDILFRPHMHDVGIGILLGAGGTLLLTSVVGYYLNRE